VTRDTVPRKVVAVLPWNWESDLMPAGGAAWRVAWRELGTWVEWYTQTFELWAVMPVCWFEHPRLVEELRALSAYHRAVVAPEMVLAPDGTVPRRGLPSAKDYWDWQFVRREWERAALGVDPRNHGGCTGPAHAAVPEATASGHAERLRRMREGLDAMLVRVGGAEGRR
jgi:hypothetical protein